MMIHKYVLDSSAQFERSLPKNACVLFVQMQGGSPVMWVLFDPKESGTEVRRFRIVATGESFGPDRCTTLTYVATFQDGGFVGHLFESKPTPVTQGSTRVVSGAHVVSEEKDLVRGSCGMRWGGGDFVHTCVREAGHEGRCDWPGKM